MSGDVKETMLAREGKYLAQCQLAKGVHLFNKILGANIDVDFHDVVDENADDEAEKTIEELELEIDGGTLRSVGFDIAPNFSTIDCIRECSQFFSIYYLPSNLSQGVISGRNGSNACMVISLLAGFAMLKMVGKELNEILCLFIGSMEVGNILYEEKESNELLNFSEGFALLPESIQIHCIEESGCIIREDISIPLNFDVPTFFLLIAEGKSYSFVVKDDHVIFSDSHANPPHGACISLILLPDFDEYIRKKFKDCYINIVVCAC